MLRYVVAVAMMCVSVNVLVTTVVVVGLEYMCLVFCVGGSCVGGRSEYGGGLLSLVKVVTKLHL